jgi:uncharacterized protein YdbL (DUF1318 family)
MRVVTLLTSKQPSFLMALPEIFEMVGELHVGMLKLTEQLKRIESQNQAIVAMLNNQTNKVEQYRKIANSRNVKLGVLAKLLAEAKAKSQIKHELYKLIKEFVQPQPEPIDERSKKDFAVSKKANTRKGTK